MKAIQKNRLAKYFIVAVLALGSIPAFAQISLSIDIAPPPLPEYEQPACPDDGYLWVPGYWAYGDYGYYWVPGTWVQPPQAGLFWTPPYWGWGGNAYIFHSGYWGANVGFYGGINYGYGYGGNGYNGGRWQGGYFSYNTAVNNVSSSNIHHTYSDRTAISRNPGGVSYNGGSGGVQAQPTAQQRQYSSARHVPPTSAQQAYVQAASQDRGQLATVNGGRPVTSAAASPTSYKRVAQQHAAKQPLTSQDKPKAQGVTSAKSSTGTSSSSQTKTAKQTTSVNHNTQATPSHETAVKSQAKPATTQQSHPAPQAQTHAQPQVSHAQPQTHAQPQVSHAQPQTHAQPQVSHAQSHPQTQAKPQSHGQPQAKSQSQSDKP